MARLALLAAVSAAVASGKSLPIATFDGKAESTWTWETVNDPVMGGKSSSTFHVDGSRSVGVWDGEVRVVPFLGAPGFCNLQAPGLYKTAAFPDISFADGIAVVGREVNMSGITHFNVMLMTKGARHGSQEGVYTANYSLTDTIESHFVAWKDFVCTWRGQHVAWCPNITTQLSQVVNIGIGTAFPGIAAKFTVELGAIVASSYSHVGAIEPIDLATFDGAVSHSWHTENDPVMGGRSDSKFEVKDGYGDYSGTCRIVPSLKAPGFTIALTETPLQGHFPDVSAADGIILGLRNVEANVTKFKFAFCDSRINPFRCQFQSFKADFEIMPSDSFGEVFLPWSAFSDKWSSYTGEHTAEDPPTASSLRSITQLQIWTEGVEGTFHLQIKYVRAGKAPQAPVSSIMLM